VTRLARDATAAPTHTFKCTYRRTNLFWSDPARGWAAESRSGPL